MGTSWSPSTGTPGTVTGPFDYGTVVQCSVFKANAARGFDLTSSFHNTDLDYQLRQRGIRNLVIAGMVTNTCVESTARYAYEL
jgi:hypothetical protein